MNKIVFNSRDELIAVDFSRVAVIQADGNYTKIIYMNKREVTLSMGISKVTETLQKRPELARNYVRFSRSIIVNHLFVERIDLLRQFIALVDDAGHEIRVKASKALLKSYKLAVLNGVHDKLSD